jgi:hypothetical protein
MFLIKIYFVILVTLEFEFKDDDHDRRICE